MDIKVEDTDIELEELHHTIVIKDEISVLGPAEVNKEYTNQMLSKSDCVVEKLKRSRASNWEDQEKRILVEVIKPYLHIIEDKKKSTSSNRKKELCWKQVRMKLSNQGYSRDMARIKEQWTRLKLLSKRRVLEQTTESPSELDLVVADAVPHLFLTDCSKSDGDNHPVVPLQRPVRISTEKRDTVECPNEPDRVDKQDRVLPEEIAQEACETIPPILNNKRISKRKADMSAYEEQMLKLNEIKFEQAMLHATEMHKLKMKNEEQLHNLKVKYETLLYEKRLAQ